MVLNHENLKISKKTEKGNVGVFEFEPLPTGFGTTLGNSFRRVLLTYIEGAAITQIKINGVNHQFTTIKGVKEDVVELTMNLKQVRFKVFNKNPIVATIKKKGPGNVTAGDIEISSDAEIMNKDLHIATLADNKTELKAELIVEPGMGYSPMEERQTSKVGVIVLDALFSPIKKVSYEVEPTRFEERTDLDKLILTIETDGSVSPEEALKRSAEILRDYYNVVLLGGRSKEETEAKEINGAISHVDNVLIEELPLQTRTINALKKHGIKTLKELASKTNEDLSDVKNLGEKSLIEIKKILEKEGLR